MTINGVKFKIQQKHNLLNLKNRYETKKKAPKIQKTTEKKALFKLLLNKLIVKYFFLTNILKMGL